MRLAIAFAAAALLCACATSSHSVALEHSATHASESEKLDTHSSGSTVEHTVQQGDTTTVYKFAPPQEEPLAPGPAPELAPAGSLGHAAAGASVPRRPLVYAADPPGLPWVPPPHGPLVEMDVTQHGPTTIDKSTSSVVDAHASETKTVDGSNDKKLDASSTMRPALSCVVTGGLWAVAVLAAIGGILWLRFGR